MSKTKIMKRNRSLRRLAFSACLLLAVVLVPLLVLAFITAPKTVAGLALCATFPGLRILSDHGAGSEGGGGGALTQEQFQQRILGGVAELRKLQTELAEKQKTSDADVLKLKETANNLNLEIEKFRRFTIAMRNTGANRPKGKLSNEAAAQLGAFFTLSLARAGKLERCVPDATLRSALLTETRSLFGIEQKDLDTGDIPLPTQYYSEIRDLIAEYGVVRNAMTPWPLSGGTDKPPRGKTRFGLTTVAMSAQFGEKQPAIEFASLESHKVGGIIYTPRELREQSIVALGQYIARLGGIAAAQVEDEWGFLADGTAPVYDSVKGVCQIASDNNKLVSMAAAKTSPADVTKENIRAIFGKVNSRVRSTGMWYMNNSWESFLPELNTQANQYVFRYTPAGVALLYGRPIVWTEVLQEFTDAAAASKYIMGFGDLSYWWFATRNNGLRIDESTDFKFDYDLISTRLIEEIDFDYMATDAFAAIKTGAGA